MGTTYSISSEKTGVGRDGRPTMVRIAISRRPAFQPSAVNDGMFAQTNRTPVSKFRQRFIESTIRTILASTSSFSASRVSGPRMESTSRP